MGRAGGVGERALRRLGGASSGAMQQSSARLGTHWNQWPMPPPPTSCRPPRRPSPGGWRPPLQIPGPAQTWRGHIALGTGRPLKRQPGAAAEPPGCHPAAVPNSRAGMPQFAKRRTSRGRGRLAGAAQHPGGTGSSAPRLRWAGSRGGRRPIGGSRAEPAQLSSTALHHIADWLNPWTLHLISSAHPAAGAAPAAGGLRSWSAPAGLGWHAQQGQRRGRAGVSRRRWQGGPAAAVRAAGGAARSSRRQRCQTTLHQRALISRRVVFCSTPQSALRGDG